MADRTAAERSRDTVDVIQHRLSTWLLVGNVGGLLFCFNALLGGRICDWSLFREVAQIFGVGAIAAFVAQFAAAAYHSLPAQRMPKSEVEAASAKLVNRFALWVTIIGFLVSAVAIYLAPSTFIMSDRYRAALCSATKAPTP